MKTTHNDTVAVYTVAGSRNKNLPHWLERLRKKSLKEDEEYQSRLVLLQDFEFPSASVCLRTSEDGMYLMSTGTYVLIPMPSRWLLSSR
jgi:ribosome biogenesis protein ENP2